MIELDRHIEILLLNNDCVIVPELGGFVTHRMEARYDETDNMFLPPIRTLGFNPQLKMNDSLLAQSYIETYDISYPEAMRRIESEVAELRQHLDSQGTYELNDIGCLTQCNDGRLAFEPCEAGILTPSLYGLDSFEMLPLAGAVRQIRPAKRKHDNTSSDSSIVIKMSWVRNAVAVAAAIVAFFLLTTPVSNNQTGLTISSLELPILKQKPAPAIVTGKKVESGSSPTLTTAFHADKPVYQPAYCIVLASQVSLSGAEAFVDRLQRKGIDARVYTYNNIRRVVTGHFTSEAQAYSCLNKLKVHEDCAEAWVYKMIEK